MKDGELFPSGRPLRAAVRPRAGASGREGLAGRDVARGPVGLVPVRRRGGAGDRRFALRFVFREGEGEPFAGSMVEYSPRSAMELRWEGDETLRLELAPAGSGCVLTLINRFDEIGKAARDAAGWHACLDVLEASLAGASIDAGARWGEVHPGYVSRFGPEAATIGPPALKRERASSFSRQAREIHHSRADALGLLVGGLLAEPFAVAAPCRSSCGLLVAADRVLEGLEADDPDAGAEVPSRPCCSTSPRPAPPPPRSSRRDRRRRHRHRRRRSRRRPGRRVRRRPGRRAHGRHGRRAGRRPGAGSRSP